MFNRKISKNSSVKFYPWVWTADSLLPSLILRFAVSSHDSFMSYTHTANILRFPPFCATRGVREPRCVQGSNCWAVWISSQGLACSNWAAASDPSGTQVAKLCYLCLQQLSWGSWRIGVHVADFLLLWRQAARINRRNHPLWTRTKTSQNYEAFGAILGHLAIFGSFGIVSSRKPCWPFRTSCKKVLAVLTVPRFSLKHVETELGWWAGGVADWWLNPSNSQVRMPRSCTLRQLKERQWIRWIQGGSQTCLS